MTGLCILPKKSLFDIRVYFVDSVYLDIQINSFYKQIEINWGSINNS